MRLGLGLYSRVLSDGKPWWYFQITHAGRRVRRGRWKTKTEAKQAADQFRAALAEGRVVSTPPQTQTLRGLLTQTGWTKNDQAYARFWLEVAGHRRPLSLTRAELFDIRSDLAKTRATQTVNHYLKFLHKILRRHFPAGMVADTWQGLGIFARPAEQRGHYMILEPEQEARLLAALALPDRQIVRLALLTGLRAGQLFGSLQWEDVSWSKRALFVRAYKRQPDRILPLPTEALTILKAWHRQQHRPQTGPLLSRDYHNWYNRTLRPALVATKLFTLRIRDGRPEGIRFQSFRRTWSTRMNLAGVPLAIIQACGGWTSLDMVDRYTDTTLEDRRRAMEKASYSTTDSTTGMADRRRLTRK